MANPILKKGDKGADVERLQDLLNRNGALLVTDGDFGKGTERAVLEAQKLAGLNQTGVADEATWRWLLSQPVPSPDMPTKAVTFIAREEVGSRKYYDTHTAKPHWPGASSGITIGIGYDLRFQSDNFDADWGPLLPDAQKARLRPFLGKKGSKAKAASVSDIKIGFHTAWKVFTTKTLSKYVAQTKAAFPGSQNLPPLCFGVLVSLVYNRGPGMAGDSRKEMRAIRDHIQNRDFDKVPGELEAMKRLWPNSAGLRGRRDREAALWREGLGK